MHVHIAVLHTGWVRWELSATLSHILLFDKRHKLSLRYYDGSGEGRPTNSNRNRIARDRPPEADVVMMVDNDIVLPGNILDLVALDLDVIGCPSPIWRDGKAIMNFATLDNQTNVTVGDGEPLEVAVIGGGCYLIARRVFDHPQMRAAFQYQYDSDGIKIGGADHGFCQRARETGFKIWAAVGHSLNHIKEIDLVQVFDAMHNEKAK